MKFKARLLDGGLAALHGHFLPALSKVDKDCVVYLTPTKLVLTQNYFTCDAVRVTASFATRVMFAEYKVKSIEKDRIAFPADVTLLQRALQSIKRIFAFEVGDVYVKLTRKKPPGADAGAKGIPYLSFVARRMADERTGQPGRVLITQDVPVGEPLPPSDLMELDRLARTAPVRTYLVLPDSVGRVAVVVDKLKALSSHVAVGISRGGRLFVRGAGGEVGSSVGVEFSQLQVLGVTAGDGTGEENGECATAPTEGAGAQREGPASRMRKAEAEGLLDKAVVDQKHLAQALCCQLTAPARTIAAIAGQRQYMVIGCQYYADAGAYGGSDALGASAYTPDVSLEFKLPVRAEEDDLDIGSQ
eukprot:PRCOL_00003381-RA